MVKRKEQNNAQTNVSCPKMVGVQMYKCFVCNKMMLFLSLVYSL